MPDYDKTTIGVLVDASEGVFRQVLLGIAGYRAGQPRWRCDRLEHRPRGGVAQTLAGWRGNGLIVQLLSESDVEAVRGLGVPVVEVFEWLDWTPAAAFVDSRAVGRLGAEHLLDLGYERLAYVERAGMALSGRRGEGFTAAAESAGREVYRLRGRGVTVGELVPWLRRLPKPVGVMAGTDRGAFRVIEACGVAGLRVPEEVAVVGAGNDPIACGFSEPALTSVELGAQRAGYEAAALLDRMIRGDAEPSEPVTVPPVRVVPRGSTAAVGGADAVVNAALSAMRQPDGLSAEMDVETLADRAGVSRRTLERRFDAVLRRSPWEVLQRARVDRAVGLLLETDRPVKSVAAQAGFTEPRQMGRAFRAVHGVTPAAYRAEHRRWL
ncbi:MAG: substrate-binding domain-containing protein [Planctomycetota bacterium]